MKNKIFYLIIFFLILDIKAVQFEPNDLKLIIQENRAYLSFIDVCLSNLTEAGKRIPRMRPQPANQEEVVENQEEVPNPNEQNEQAEANAENAAEDQNVENANNIEEDQAIQQPDTYNDEYDISSDNVLASPYYERFMDVNQNTMNGDMLYLEGRYNLSYKYLKKSQKTLKNLYRDISDVYLDSSQVVLQQMSPVVIQSDDRIGRFLLKRGFSYLRRGKDYHVYALNLSKFMYRDKLIMYKKVIREARKARRYAVLATIASQTPLRYKENYRFISFEEAKGMVEKITLTDYKRINFVLNDYVTNGFIKQTISIPRTAKYRFNLDFFEIHDDNYEYITNDRKSFLDVSNSKIVVDDILQKEELPAIPEVNTEQVNRQIPQQQPEPLQQ